MSNLTPLLRRQWQVRQAVTWTHSPHWSSPCSQPQQRSPHSVWNIIKDGVCNKEMLIWMCRRQARRCVYVCVCAGGVLFMYSRQWMMETLEGTGPEHCCRDLGTRQSPMQCEMPVWVGTVPNGCSLLQDRLRGPRGASPSSGCSRRHWLGSQSGTQGRQTKSRYSHCSYILIYQSGESLKDKNASLLQNFTQQCERKVADMTYYHAFCFNW